MWHILQISWERILWRFFQVSDYKKDNAKKLLNFLIGQVQKELRGKANAKTVAQILLQKLSE